MFNLLLFKRLLEKLTQATKKQITSLLLVKVSDFRFKFISIQIPCITWRGTRRISPSEYKKKILWIRNDFLSRKSTLKTSRVWNYFVLLKPDGKIIEKLDRFYINFSSSRKRNLVGFIAQCLFTALEVLIFFEQNFCH